MKLAILSRGPRSYSTRRLKEAALQRDHEVKVLDTLKFAIDLQKGVPDLYFRQKNLSTYDAVLPRIGASITYRLAFGTNAGKKALTLQAVPTSNNSAKSSELVSKQSSFSLHAGVVHASPISVIN